MAPRCLFGRCSFTEAGERGRGVALRREVTLRPLHPVHLRPQDLLCARGSPVPIPSANVCRHLLHAGFVQGARENPVLWGTLPG